MAHPTVVAGELNILNRYCKQLRILEDYLAQYEEGKFSPRILMAGSTRNEKIDQIGKTMDVDIKAYIRELFSDVWIKEYGSTQNLFENAPDVLKVKADLETNLFTEELEAATNVHINWQLCTPDGLKEKKNVL